MQTGNASRQLSDSPGAVGLDVLLHQPLQKGFILAADAALQYLCPTKGGSKAPDTRRAGLQSLPESILDKWPSTWAAESWNIDDWRLQFVS